MSEIEEATRTEMLSDGTLAGGMDDVIRESRTGWMSGNTNAGEIANDLIRAKAHECCAAGGNARYRWPRD